MPQVLLYVLFMFFVDVPMYWSRWIADEAGGRGYLSIAQGALDALDRRVVSHRWADWQSEIAWMSLYFSVAVWMSIALIHTPVSAPHPAAGGATPPPARRPVFFRRASVPGSSRTALRPSGP